jgi:KUP system potassium uptake protein
LLAAGSVAACFILIDSTFVLANLSKVAEGGYIPLLLAIVVYGIMWIWHRGAAAVTARIHEASVPIPAYMAKIKADKIPRVPGAAVFLTRSKQGVPPVMIWHVKHNRALHEQLLILRVRVKPIPKVPPSQRLSIKELSTNFWRAEAQYGFMERPDIPELLKTCASQGCPLNLSDLTYYIGRDTIIGREDGKGLPAWQMTPFAMMERNAAHVSDFFSLPSDEVVEIGRQIAI